ncbi:hypothetical protein [Microvirga roseola]|uniref:hypothetical protein n=1 Tax=Microvirga roseola TaxID=2883126 RepID=UPI001E2BACB8|nr:hypothetical protein [Microvirga roseola]
MAETKNLAGLDGTQTVSALGLRWAALRGMLNSPLISVEDQRPLRDELLRELETLEQDFSAAQSRSALEISAKVDVAKAALQDRLQPGQSWLLDLLESIQMDLQSTPAKPAQTVTSRPTTNLTRSSQLRPDESPTPAMPESSAPAAA